MGITATEWEAKPIIGSAGARRSGPAQLDFLIAGIAKSRCQVPDSTMDRCSNEESCSSIMRLDEARSITEFVSVPVTYDQFNLRLLRVVSRSWRFCGSAEAAYPSVLCGQSLTAFPLP